ncbi:hypothetical protein FZEAL_9726 [Fusarium zealandicum]|uniref:Heterokaryon incompatibility domain-containing protein n=1 Tax=Fusarium zealandicum TaxID=1053134 RepID=A0A8H4XF66_9HYPO|nr:hypothetical protein FZEAL_9726 [Fusarium zealandicum]
MARLLQFVCTLLTDPENISTHPWLQIDFKPMLHDDRKKFAAVAKRHLKGLYDAVDHSGTELDHLQQSCRTIRDELTEIMEAMHFKMSASMNCFSIVDAITEALGQDRLALLLSQSIHLYAGLVDQVKVLEGKYNDKLEHPAILSHQQDKSSETDTAISSESETQAVGSLDKNLTTRDGINNFAKCLENTQALQSTLEGLFLEKHLLPLPQYYWKEDNADLVELHNSLKPSLPVVFSGIPSESNTMCVQCLGFVTECLPLEGRNGRYDYRAEMVLKDLAIDSCALCRFFLGMVELARLRRGKHHDHQPAALSLNSVSPRLLLGGRNWPSFTVRTIRLHVKVQLSFALAESWEDSQRRRGSRSLFSPPRAISRYNVSFTEVTDVLVAWWNQCRNEHRSCAIGEETRKLPTRAINVKELCTTGRIFLEPTQGHLGHYLALSHCWGGDISVKTTTDNIGSFTTRLPYEKLPATFKDAVSVTRRLGFDYLWVDALCVIQDSQEDWDQESRMMGQTFSHAAIVLAAVDSVDPSAGLITKRTAPDTVEIPAINTKEVEFEPGRFPASSKKLVLQPDKHASVSNSVWRRRGWTLQQEALARRIIYFNDKSLWGQFTWSCGERYWREDGHDKEGNYHSFERVRGDSIHTRLVNIESWYKMVSGYSSRELTHSSDRLRAFQGMASLFSEQAESCMGEYYHGLWKKDLAFGLCWKTETLKTEVEDRGSGAEAPSWSWGSIVASVSWPERQWGGQGGAVHQDHPAFSVEPDSSDFERKRLLVTGMVTPTVLSADEVKLDSPGGSKVYKSVIQFDTQHRPTPEYFLLYANTYIRNRAVTIPDEGVSSQEGIYFFLILECVDDQNSVYIRRGTCETTISEPEKLRGPSPWRGMEVDKFHLEKKALNLI